MFNYLELCSHSKKNIMKKEMEAKKACKIKLPPRAKFELFNIQESKIIQSFKIGKAKHINKKMENVE